MLSRNRVSLNALAEESTCKLIASVLQHGVNVTEVYIDTVGDADKYQKRLSQRFQGLKFTVCPKADALYPIVSAASIVAKVTRDNSLTNLNASQGSGFGSGYPSDPVTKQWLEKNVSPIFGYPSMVRFSWSTCTTIMDTQCVDVLWECENEDGNTQQSLKDAFSGTPFRSEKNRFSYFKARKIQKSSSEDW
jgi:ribonuclease H2 subunit A